MYFIGQSSLVYSHALEKQNNDLDIFLAYGKAKFVSLYTSKSIYR